MCNLTCTKYIIFPGLIVTGGHDNLILVWTLDTLGKFYKKNVCLFAKVYSIKAVVVYPEL